MNSGAERFNGLMAMLGIIAGIGAYATTGQLIPGIYWFLANFSIDYCLNKMISKAIIYGRYLTLY